MADCNKLEMGAFVIRLKRSVWTNGALKLFEKRKEQTRCGFTSYKTGKSR